MDFDCVEYALLRYDEEFGREDYGFPFLKPYQKYTMRGLALLCNYEKTHSAFRGSGVLCFSPRDYFIFVDLYKEDTIEARFNYDDYFLTPGTFHWQGPDNWKKSHKNMDSIIHHMERAIQLHLFIRKFKEVEGIPQDYTYFGKCAVFPDSVKTGDKPSPVSMLFAIPEVPPVLYDDFTTPADKTRNS